MSKKRKTAQQPVSQRLLAREMERSLERFKSIHCSIFPTSGCLAPSPKILLKSCIVCHYFNFKNAQKTSTWKKRIIHQKKKEIENRKKREKKSLKNKK